MDAEHDQDKQQALDALRSELDAEHDEDKQQALDVQKRELDAEHDEDKQQALDALKSELDAEHDEDKQQALDALRRELDAEHDEDKQQALDAQKSELDQNVSERYVQLVKEKNLNVDPLEDRAVAHAMNTVDGMGELRVGVIAGFETKLDQVLDGMPKNEGDQLGYLSPELVEDLKNELEKKHKEEIEEQRKLDEEKFEEEKEVIIETVRMEMEEEFEEEMEETITRINSEWREKVEALMTLLGDGADVHTRSQLLRSFSMESDAQYEERYGSVQYEEEYEGYEEQDEDDALYLGTDNDVEEGGSLNESLEEMKERLLLEKRRALSELKEKLKAKCDNRVRLCLEEEERKRNELVDKLEMEKEESLELLRQEMEEEFEEILEGKGLWTESQVNEEMGRRLSELEEKRRKALLMLRRDLEEDGSRDDDSRHSGSPMSPIFGERKLNGLDDSDEESKDPFEDDEEGNSDEEWRGEVEEKFLFDKSGRAVSSFRFTKIKSMSDRDLGDMDKYREESLQKSQEGKATSKGWLRSSLLQSPENVDFSDLSFEDDHLKIISENLEASPIKVLFLSGNNFTDEGVEFLCKQNHLAMYHKLETLFLDNNDITDKGCEMIAEALGSNHTLKVLSLSNNLFSDEAAEYFASHLVFNNGLALESLYGVDLSPYKAIMDIGESVPQNFDDSGQPTNMSILTALRESIDRKMHSIPTKMMMMKKRLGDASLGTSGK